MKNGISKYNAFLFDLNGTMVDDMDYHVKAWHTIIKDLGTDLSMEKVKAECYGKNNDLLERIFPGRFSEQEMDKMGAEKERQYRSEFKPNLSLIKGLDNLLKKAFEEKIKLAIGSAAITGNIDFVLDGLGIRNYFDVIVSADDVEHSKPDPETFTKCAALLHIPAKDCLVFEDAPKGVEAAHNAGMDCVVLTTMHGKEEFTRYPNVITFISDYTALEF